MKKTIIITALIAATGLGAYQYANANTCKGLTPAFSDYEKARSLRSGKSACEAVQHYQRYGALSVPSKSWLEIASEKLKQANSIRKQINALI